MTGGFLTELLLLVAVATAGAALFERLRLPSIAGFLVMGALVGPGGLGLIADPERVRALAELGVVFLLFEIGLELPLERLRRLWRPALVAGGAQVALTVACVAALGAALGLDARSATVLGALVAMSSTALVMRLLSQRGEIDAPQGQLAVGILLFQDLCVVPFLLVVPILAVGGSAASAGVALGIGRAVAALALFAVVSRFVLPAVLERVARVQSRELFTMVAFLAVMGSAVIAEEIGLTLSVGAFVGGLVLSASPYSHQLFAEVLPLRGVLLGVFFTAVGMLFDPSAAAAQWPAVLAYASGVLVLKAGFVAAIVAIVLRQGLRLGILTGLALAQTGEFSFVLAEAAADAQLLDAGLRQVFVAGSIATLVATPLLVAVSPRLASFVVRRADRGEAPALEGAVRPADHVVLVGFGHAGQSLARVLKARGIPYAAVDSNAVAVREARVRDEPVVYGDATRPSILERVGVPSARLVVVAVSDPIATREVVALARSLAPHAPILARTRYVLDVDGLAQAGATKVVAEELESTLELVGEALQHFGVPQEAVARFAAELRDEGYVFLRTPETILDPWLAELLEGVAAHWVEVPDGFSRAASLARLNVRQRTGASVVAIERGGVTTPSPDPAFGVRAGDRLLAVGVPEAIDRLRRLVQEPGEPE
ncbi:MAG: cation:proton antiporter [Myxococcales bacterium]|nr:cation:proton antiporter [Myxococcales bacterium]